MTPKQTDARGGHTDSRRRHRHWLLSVNLVRNLAESPAFEVAHLCDLRPEALEAITRRYPSIPCTTQFEEILGRRWMSVAIATPVSTHHSACPHSRPASMRSSRSHSLLRATKSSLREGGRGEEPRAHAWTHILQPVGDDESSSRWEGCFFTSSRVNLGLHRPWCGTSAPMISRSSATGLAHFQQKCRRSVLPGVPDVCFIDPAISVPGPSLTWQPWLHAEQAQADSHCRLEEDGRLRRHLEVRSGSSIPARRFPIPRTFFGNIA